MSLTHIDDQGNPSMVDVGAKAVTRRTATARCYVDLPEEVMREIDGDELVLKKGPVFQTAILAGVMGSKQTSSLIPLCHPLGLENCKVFIEKESDNSIRIDCIASIEGKTGVEMEALTGASVAALTVYDMCKALSHDIVIRDLKLISKTGGKRDFNRET
jgi:cyclic pyranopterin phosphate synthase